jgi:RimJ/RimL family protein N-acetyltransferase
MISIRKLKHSDAERITSLLQEKKVVDTLGSLPWPYQLSDAEYFLNQTIKNDLLHRGIIVDDEFIGVGGVKDFDGRQGELGYWIGMDYWGKGYVSKAAALIIDEAKVYGAQRIWAQVVTTNPASIRVLEKNNFQRTTPEAVRNENNHLVYRFELMLV